MRGGEAAVSGKAGDRGFNSIRRRGLRTFAFKPGRALATTEQRAAMRAESANADLQDALARLRDQLGAANQALNMAQGRIGTLSDEAKSQQAVSEQAASTKADRVTQLTHALEQAQREL